MTDMITAILAHAALLVFLGILLWWIKALPLIIIVGATLVLVVYDFVHELLAHRSEA